MSGKSQSSLIVLVMIAMLIIFIWIFSLFWNQASQARTLASEKFTKLGKYLDIVKGISRNYLVFSSQMATKKVAKDVTTYYYNGPTPRTINQIRYTLSKESLKLLNKYVDNTHFKEAVIDFDVDKLKFKCVDFPIDEDRLDAREYDEKYYVGGYGSVAEVSDENNKVSSDNDIFETVTGDRFFLLYRKFVDWSNSAQFHDDTAACLMNACQCYDPEHICQLGDKTCEQCPQFYSCMTELWERERNRLVGMMGDPYIECSYTKTCCVFQVDDVGVDYEQDVWMPWDRAPSCRERNGPEESDFVCSKQLSFSSQEKFNPENYKVIKFERVISKPVCEQRVAYKVTYSCVDTKYKLSIPLARELQFDVDVTEFVRRHCG